MKPRLLLYAIEPLHEFPEVCDVCGSNPPMLSYEFDEYGDTGEPREQKGFCCWRCANNLLQKLEHAEARRWVEERATLKVDEFDISAFREDRIAAVADSVQ